jgi:hypothetical protein
MRLLPFIIAASVLQQTSLRAAPQAPSTPAADLLGTGHTPTPSEMSSTSTDTPVDTPPDGTLNLQGGSLAAGIGFVWGHGTVNYQGDDHKFNIHGVSVVDVGGATISATGVVMHLEKLSDFAGTYVAWGAGVTVAAGGSVVYMKNEHGVVIKLLSKTEGLRFNLSGNGVKVTLRS